MQTNLKIGYIPYSADLSQPADRRRFLHFAQRKKIACEIADPKKKYDVIILPAPSNLSKWLLYKRKNPSTIFIFEMVDSLIFSTDVFSKLFKGIGRFLLRKESLLHLNHRKLILKWIQIADVVLCSSTEVKSHILKWNKNVIISLDYLENEYSSVKIDYKINEKMKLVWEGQGSVLPHFLHFKKVLERLNSFCELHIITSEKYSLYGTFLKKDVSEILNQLPIKTVFHKWDIDNKDKILSQCDCGIIPLNKNNLFGWHKPANKLISFWFTGLPSVVSATPAYQELMNNAGENLYCFTNNDWVEKICKIKNMSIEERAAFAKKNLNYVHNNYSDETLDLIWNKVFEGICS